jgi:dolichol kinase
LQKKVKKMLLKNEKTNFRQELTRQGVHFLVGIACILLFLLAGRILSIILLFVALIAGYLIAHQIKHHGHFKFLHEIVKHVERSHEQHFPGLPVFLFLFGAILTMAIFSNFLVIVAALIVLTFGDSIATLLGKYYGNIELVSNRTLEGTVAGIAVSTVALSFFLPLQFAFPIAGIGMLAEYLPIDDNLGIPIVAALTASMLL